jgi:lipid-A-disaccharide synthase
MKLLVSALENSANIHLKYLLDELGDDIELEGIFSSEFAQPIVDMRSNAIMGIGAAIKKIPFFLKLADRMLEAAESADKVLLMDSSGFNLPLARKIKKSYPDKEIIYYILPQAWAWRRSRIEKLTRYCDRLCSILPFESSYYPEGSPIEYVGHPLLDEIELFKDEPPEKRERIAFLPGSRRSEIVSLMPHYRELRKRLDIKEALLVIPEYFCEEEISSLYGDLSAFKISHDAKTALYRSDFAFICSGTATLESALTGTPFVLSYIAKKFDYMIASRVVKLEYIGLANIFSSHFQGRSMHPELIQERVDAKNLLEAYEKMDTVRFAADVKALRNYLEHGSARRVAEIIMRG